tara:strand:- start:126 stop:965 length:840 start_codon:yes stop_codon:yes gene_type:complete
MHYYKRNIGDYHKKAGRLSMLEHGAYTLLMDAIYDREKFPTLEEAIDWVWASKQDEIDAITFVLTKFFAPENGVYIQNRMQEELEEYTGTCLTNSINGKKGGRPKGSKNKPKETESVNNKTQSVNLKSETKANESEAKPNHKPLTNNHKPLTNNQGLKDIGDKAAFEIFWTAGMRKTDKKQAYPIFTKLAKDNGGAEAFANQLARDVRARIAAGQFGFDTLSPMRYLKNERFNDEVKQATQSPPTGETEDEFLLRVNRGVMPEGYGRNDFIDSTYEVLK